jgi:hypothetical protein
VLNVRGKLAPLYVTHERGKGVDAAVGVEIQKLLADAACLVFALPKPVQHVPILEALGLHRLYPGEVLFRHRVQFA